MSITAITATHQLSHGRRIATYEQATSGTSTSPWIVYTVCAVGGSNRIHATQMPALTSTSSARRLSMTGVVNRTL